MAESGLGGLSPLRISGVYLLLSLGWILGSDAAVEALAGPSARSSIQSVKGVGFVALTTGVLYLLVRRYGMAVLRSREALRVGSAELSHQRAARAVVAEALGRLGHRATPEETAASVCAELVGVPGIDGGAIVVFGAGGAPSVLASCLPAEARRSDLDRMLGTAAGLRMRERAEGGLWVEDWRADGPGAMEVDALGTLSLRAAIHVPLREDDRVFGVLVAASSSSPGELESSGRVTSAVSFAVVASALLGGPVATQRRDADLRAVIEASIARRGFAPVFQPIVELQTGRVVGHEALTRFADGTPPQQRFAEAETADLGLELEEACLRAALGAASTLPAGTWLSVNVSPRMALAHTRLSRILKRGDRPIILELTEHVVVGDYPAVRDSIATFGDHVRLAVDDAGAGFANFRHIIELHPAYVKLDAALVRDISHDPARQALITGLRYFAARTGSVLIAEGVETEEERHTLIDLTVDLGQGYLFGRPEPATRTRRTAAISATR